eukprot:scaffold62360_cov18-Tisochrysis_lutea.AAC.1
MPSCTHASTQPCLFVCKCHLGHGLLANVLTHGLFVHGLLACWLLDTLQVSELTKRDIAQHLGIPLEPILVRDPGEPTVCALQHSQTEACVLSSYL